MIGGLFTPLLAGANFRDRLIACVGALIGIGATAAICAAGPGGMLLAAPIGASAVLLFAVPVSPLSQPWPIVGGNIVSAAVGMAVAQLVPDWPVAAGLAVALAILCMSLLRCLHPPGGGTALLPVIGGGAVQGAGFGFALWPVGVNALVLVLTGMLFHRLSGHSYPHRPASRMTVPDDPRFRPEDVDAALAELGETFDVAREDLDRLFQAAERHASMRRG